MQGKKWLANKTALHLATTRLNLSDEERPLVTVLQESLEWIAAEIKGGNRRFEALENTAKARIVAAGFKVDYVTLCNSKTLDLAADDDLEITVLGAMFTQAARLIDNLSITL